MHWLNHVSTASVCGLVGYTRAHSGHGAVVRGHLHHHGDYLLRECVLGGTRLSDETLEAMGVGGTGVVLAGDFVEGAANMEIYLIKYWWKLRTYTAFYLLKTAVSIMPDTPLTRQFFVALDKLTREFRARAERGER